MEKNRWNIAIFDSGIGGLTVMQEIMEIMPEESIIYLGDTARVPYGNKSAKTIVRYSLESATFLSKKKIKLLVVACNTISAHALEDLACYLDFPVVGVILPGFSSLMKETKNFRVAILGTRATVSSGIYRKLIKEHYPQAEVFSVACPLFVPLVEEGFIDHPITKMAAEEYLTPLKGKVDAALLACTHYPLLRGVIQKIFGEEAKVIDSASTCAEMVKEILSSHNLKAPLGAVPSYQYFVSDDPVKFQSLGQKFLGKKITAVEVAEW